MHCDAPGNHRSINGMVNPEDLRDSTKAKLYHMVTELKIDIDTLLRIITDVDEDTEKKTLLECLEAVGIMLEEIFGDLTIIELTLKKEESH